MPRILLAWELGSGLGHIGPLRAIGGELVRRGHAVAIATPPANVELCRQALVGTGVGLFSLPGLPPASEWVRLPGTYADLLHDCGYASPRPLAPSLTAGLGLWLELLAAYRPDLVVADHSPTALLASRLGGWPSVAMGTGFVCPPDITPLPSLRPGNWETAEGRGIEKRVLEGINAALTAHGGQPLARVGEIFSSCRLTQANPSQTGNIRALSIYHDEKDPLQRINLINRGARMLPVWLCPWLCPNCV